MGDNSFNYNLVKYGECEDCNKKSRSDCFLCTDCVWCNKLDSCINLDIDKVDEDTLNNCEEWYKKNNDNKTTTNILKKVESESETAILYDKMKSENDKQIKQKDADIIYNLSLKEIANKLIETLINIIDDIYKFFNKQSKSYNDFFNIFLKDDRLIYVGIITVIISLLLFFISVTK
jgi:hypothetical protein